MKMIKVWLCLAVLVSMSIPGDALRCYVCSDCDEHENIHEASDCLENQDTCVVGRFGESIYRACSTNKACKAGKLLHDNLNQAWDSVKGIFNDDDQLGKEIPKMECCFTHLCNGSESISVPSFFLLVMVVLANLA